MKKEEKDKPIEYFLFDIKVECLVPATLVYKIRSTSAEEALKEFDKKPPNQFTPHIRKKKISKAVVYGSGSLIVKATKNYK